MGTYRLKVNASCRYARDTDARRNFIGGVFMNSSRAGWKPRAWLDTRAGSGGALGVSPVSHSGSTRKCNSLTGVPPVKL